ncbi:MAG TPA: type I restriction enzyme HsdR N-terminal domain-containing protein, partial [Balneolaceae bacterium]|nr:type I restriction enzyme HsdR N-terminal domain-containing protein [Balneolaceae bacterium]
DQIKLSDSTAVQAARYNSLLHAPYIILTNGREDLVYKVEDGTAKSTNYPLNIFQEPNVRRLDYWQKRGFCSEVMQPALKKRMEWLQSGFWMKSSFSELTYLSFKESFLPIPMDHFYQIFTEKDEKKLAVTVIGYGASANYIIAVLNQKGVNRGVCVINLDEIIAGINGSVQLFLQNREILLESEELRELIVKEQKAEFHRALVNILLSFFD